MHVTFHLEAQLRVAAGQATVALDLPPDASLEAALKSLAHALGDPARGHILNATGALRSSLLIVVNGEAVYSEEAATLTLTDGTEVLLMPPIAGG